MPLRALALPALLAVAAAAASAQEPPPTYAPQGEALPVPAVDVPPLAAGPGTDPDPVGKISETPPGELSLPTFAAPEEVLPGVSPPPSPAAAAVEPEGVLPDVSPPPSSAGADAEPDVIDPISETPPRADVAGGASRPGDARRRDAATPAMPPSLGPVRGSGGSPGASGVPLDVSGCPRALVRGRLAAAAADGDDPIVALGVETELLRLCADRQAVVTALLEGERELRALRDGAAVESGPRAVEIVEQLLAPPEPVDVPAPVDAQAAEAPPVPTLEPAAEPPPPPEYGWFSIIGRTGQLTAGVTDGAGVWWVAPGDALPGGVRVSAIAGRPAAVTVAGALSGALPHRSAP